MLASKGHPIRMKKSGTAETLKFYVFVSLKKQRDGNVFLLIKSIFILLDFERGFQNEKNQHYGHYA